MSIQYPRNQQDPLSLVAFDEGLLETAVRTAWSSPRRRTIIRFHEYSDVVQRMLNAIEPESYVRPHRHVNPPKPETFVALRGSVLVVRFSEDGAPIEGVVASADGPVRGVEVPPGAWHTFISLRSGTVLFEVTQGPYDEASNKHFAPWAPAEGDAQATAAFIAAMRGHFEPLLAKVAAIDEIEAESDA